MRESRAITPHAAGSSFRRDAETSTRDACAPRTRRARTLRLLTGTRGTVFAAMRPPRVSVHEKHERRESTLLRAACLLRRLLFVASVFFVDVAAVRAEEPFFKKGDVIAIVGGEDMVALSEYGYLELLLTRALPDHRLRFRNLAWEGDTVFEQRRDLGFPTWEEQLEKIGATVVLCQFGQMESLGKGEGRKAKGDGASKEEIAEFSAAYEKLLARFSGGGKRRVLVVTPVTFGSGYYSNRSEERRVGKECVP